MDRGGQQAEAPAQPIVALGQMVAGIAAMQQEQAEANRQFLGALRDTAERQAYALEQIAARSLAVPLAPAPSPNPPRSRG